MISSDAHTNMSVNEFEVFIISFFHFLAFFVFFDIIETTRMFTRYWSIWSSMSFSNNTSFDQSIKIAFTNFFNSNSSFRFKFSPDQESTDWLDRAWTYDFLINSQTLYQLSYEPKIKILYRSIRSFISTGWDIDLTYYHLLPLETIYHTVD